MNKPLLSARTWFVLATLAVTGQIAWAVENSWFNTFVYDMLTPDPRPVAWMVAARDIASANGITGEIVERYVPGWTPESFPEGYSWEYRKYGKKELF